MSDLLEDTVIESISNRRGADRSRISLGQGYEVRYWMKSLGVSAQELSDAIDAVGNSADMVRVHLTKQRLAAHESSR